MILSFADVDNALVAIRETRTAGGYNARSVAASWWAFKLSEQQLRAGTADGCGARPDLDVIEAGRFAVEAQLARLLAIVSLYQALGGGWEPRMKRPVDAL